jgi:hypothetical protein
VQVEAAGETRLFMFLPDATGRILPGAASRVAPSASIRQVEHDLEPARMDELSLGAECTLGEVWRLGLTYVHRKTDGLPQDEDINHFTCRQSGSAIGIDPLAVCPDPNGQLAIDRFGTIGGGFPGISLPNGLEDLYAFSPEVNQVLRVSGVDGLDDDSWELSIVRPMQHNWQMQAGYTLSRARGEAAETFSVARDDASVLPRRRTTLDHDQRHSLEVQAAGRLPRDVTLSTAIRWDSGTPFTVVGSPVTDLDSARNVVPRTLLPSGEANNQRNEGIWRVDARVEKGFQIRRVRASAFLTVMNLLNDDSLTVSRYTQGGFVDGFRDFGRRFEIGSIIGF